MPPRPAGVGRRYLRRVHDAGTTPNAIADRTVKTGDHVNAEWLDRYRV